MHFHLINQQGDRGLPGNDGAMGIGQPGPVGPPGEKGEMVSSCNCREGFFSSRFSVSLSHFWIKICLICIKIRLNVNSDRRSKRFLCHQRGKQADDLVVMNRFRNILRAGLSLACGHLNCHRRGTAPVSRVHVIRIRRSVSFFKIQGQKSRETTLFHDAF